MKQPTTVTLDGEVLEVLARAAEREDRSRSWLVNYAVREWAKSRGVWAALNSSAPCVPPGVD